MEATHVLRCFGLFVVEDCLGLDLCARIRAEMRSAAQTPAKMAYAKGTRLDRRVRSTALANVSRATVDLVSERYSALEPRLREHFGFQPGPCEEPQFLRYREGDYFRIHTDNSKGAAPRRLSLVVFLNDPSEQPRRHCYGGGALTFYGLIDDSRAAKLGIPMPGKAGAAVAFPSGVLHEVEPVTHGERYTIVSWYR